MKARRGGFTLVEVLVVVVIIAVLAALILPRLTRQAENAYIAGAQRTLGMLRAGQERHLAITGSYLQTSMPATEAEWKTLGLQPINDPNFNYWCAQFATWTCTAWGVRGNINLTLTEGAAFPPRFECGGEYYEIENGTGKGCRV